MMNCTFKLLPTTETFKNQCRLILIVFAAVLLNLSSATAFAQSSSTQQQDAITVEGAVRNSAGEPVADASVLLEEKGHSSSVETKTNAEGAFVFSARGPGIYTVRAEKSGWRNGFSNSLVLSAGDKKHVDLVLESLVATLPTSSGASPSSVSAPGAMEFEDKPNFTVAGVTDWNNMGIHGSDINLRTSEALAKETLALKSGGPGETSAGAPKAGAPRLNSGESENKLRSALLQSSGSFEANHQLGEFYFLSERYHEAIPLLEAAYQINPGNQANAYDLALAYRANGDFERAREHARKMLENTDRAETHRLLGDLDEQLGDPLEAVREYERAARLDPSEQNYFEWGTELLLHRADRPAVEVFTEGSIAHPDSARMLAGMGAALYAGGSYDEATRRLCEASDLKPADSNPYLFLGKMEKAAPALLPCGEQKLERFVREQPGNALANYYYAITLWKRDRGSENPAGLQLAETLLEKAVTIDPKLGEAYLQLGILYSARDRFEQAIRAYKKAIEVSPQLGEAYYRLGLAYRRIGEESKAAQEFQVYEKVEKTETATIERQRRELRQFLIILKDQPAASSPR
jgi:tetratricopeptide (TPR) repeat protein